MCTKSIIKRLIETGKLPSPSPVVLSLIHLAGGRMAALEDIVDLIETDHDLSNDLARYANTVLLVPERTAQSLRRMVAKLDIRIVVSLALGFSLLKRHRTGNCDGLDYLSFWSGALAQAVAARSIAEIQNRFNPDELFACALLSHIGVLALADIYPDEYAEFIKKRSSGPETLLMERELFGITHLELTAEMLQKWGLSPQNSLVVQFHENPNRYNFPDTQSFEISQLLYLSLLLSKILTLEFPLLEKINLAEQLAEKYSIRENEFGPFFDKLVYHWQEWSLIFDIPCPQYTLYDQIRTLEGKQTDKQDLPSNRSKICILIVDDDPLILIGLSKILSGEGKEILTAEDGEEALNIALEKQPHMIITDWRMPKMNGLELCRILRRTSTTQHIYIVMLTNCKTDDELIRAFEVGVDDFITKPYTSKVLQARIRSGERLIRYQKTIGHDREVIQKYAAQLTSANRQLQTMAMTDPLTGLPNRRSAMNRLASALAETVRHGEKLSCIMIDIDHFKKVNDTFGHESGDMVLKAIAATFHRKARMNDIVSRTGGEEFMVICTRSGLLESQQLAERLRTAIADLRITLDTTFIQVTISLGVATWRAEFVNGEALIRAADQALYKAKKNGRNRVELTNT